MLEIIESVEKRSLVKWKKQSEVEWGEVKCSIGRRGRRERVFMEKVYRSSMWGEVKDWGESVSELMIVKKKIQETVDSTLLFGCFYFLYMLYSNLSRVVCC